MEKPIERGIWIYTKNPKEPSELQNFWTRLLIQFGLDVKLSWYGGNIDYRAVVIVINDPSYIR
jgi:hypothetical protein